MSFLLNSHQFGEKSTSESNGLALFAINFFHQIVKDWCSHAFPTWQHQALQHSNFFSQVVILDGVRLGFELTPLFCTPRALTGQVSGLPYQIDSAGRCHDQTCPGNQRSAIDLGKYNAECCRPAENLHETNDVAGSTVEPGQALPVSASKTGLQYQVISIRIYPQLIFHYLILENLLRLLSRHYLVVLLVLALSSFLRRFCQGIGVGLVVRRVCL